MSAASLKRNTLFLRKCVKKTINEAYFRPFSICVDILKHHSYKFRNIRHRRRPTIIGYLEEAIATVRPLVLATRLATTAPPPRHRITIRPNRKRLRRRMKWPLPLPETHLPVLLLAERSSRKSIDQLL